MDKKYWLWLVMAFGAGNRRIWTLMEEIDTPEEAYNILKSGSLDSRLLEKEVNAIKTTHLKQAESLIEYCEQHKINITCFSDNDYPNSLKTIFNPPCVLFYLGNIAIAEETVSITVVGTRNPSQYSIEVAKRICADLAKIDVTIISGFAVGLDTVAHDTTLDNKGHTVAVLGCGLDVDYPRGRTGFKYAIASTGAVVTEYLPGTKPTPYNFPQRNRILSGLGKGTLVIEAGEGSGCLITAEYAIEQGREVFCIPPANIFDKRYSGAVRLLRDGAVSVYSYLDIVYEYYTVFTHKISMLKNPYESYADTPRNIFDTVKSERKPKKQNLAIDSKAENTEQVIENTSQNSYENLTDSQRKIVAVFGKNEEINVDEISDRSGLSISEILMELTELEIDGVVTALAGKQYRLS